MVVEIFRRGTKIAFTDLLMVCHNVSTIDNSFDSDRLILTRPEHETLVLDASAVELRVIG